MRRHPYIFLYLGILFITAIMAACSNEDCPINNTVQGNMAFYSPHGDAVAFTGTLTVSVVRPQGDSVVINRMSNTSKVTFPLSYAFETDTLIFNYNNGAAYDSLYIRHTNIPTLVSIDCGTAMYHTITSVSSTHHVIDTLILKSPEVNYDERENIQVIYHIAD